MALPRPPSNVYPRVLPWWFVSLQAELSTPKPYRSNPSPSTPNHPMQGEKWRGGATVRSEREREREALVCPPWGRHRSKVSLPMGEFNLPCRHSWISYPATAQPSAFIWRAGAYGTGDREPQETLSRMCAVPTWASLCSFVHSYCQY